MPAMNLRSIGASAIVVLGLSAAGTSRADDAKDDKAESCPMHAQHMKAAADAHAAGVKVRGAEGMGFSQDTTRHHFRLLADGGAIEVSVADPDDADSRDQIQRHLSAIAHGVRGRRFPAADVHSRHGRRRASG